MLRRLFVFLIISQLRAPRETLPFFGKRSAPTLVRGLALRSPVRAEATFASNCVLIGAESQTVVQQCDVTP